MNKLYVLLCENWSGTTYDKELLEIFKDEELARRTALECQGKIPKCDIRYYVEVVDYNDLEV